VIYLEPLFLPQHSSIRLTIYKFIPSDKFLLIFDYIINSFKMARNRSISSIIGNKPTKRPSQPRSSRKKRDNKVPCYCNKCNGKLVLKRTKLFHESAGGSTTIQDSGNEQLSTELLTHDAGSPPHLEPETGLQPLGTETADALRTETSSPPH
jgi:hypothetical protein